MNRHVVVLGAAALAASAMSLAAPTSAEAKKGFLFGGGGHHHHQPRWYRRPIYVTPVYTETYTVKKRAQPAPAPQKKIVVTYADGKGRVFDPTSKVWHDGDNHCWSGQLPWTFKGGSWFYGSHRWSQSGGVWRTSAPEAPFTVDCQSVPAFAAKLAPDSSGSGGAKEFGGHASEAPVKTADKQEAEPGNTAPAATECKKYFPNVGEMLPVPCKK
jgi:hypothetical protein